MKLGHVGRMVAVVACLVMALGACGGPKAASPVHPKLAAPKPDLRQFVPSSAQVISEANVRLSGSTARQVVVTYAEETATGGGFRPDDLLLLDWDPYARRWVKVFDAADGGTNAPLPSNGQETNLSYSTITPTPGRTDLAIWADVSFGSTPSLYVTIVHYADDSAGVAYSTNQLSPTTTQPSVTGGAPHEQLSVPARWLTADDPECCGIRNYTETIGWKTGPTAQGGGQYAAVSSTQSWLGVYAELPVSQATSKTPSNPDPIVMTVVPGSPAAGTVQPGDQLVSVAGPPPPAANTLGPPVIDEIAKRLPGATVALTIRHDGLDKVVHVKLASTAAPAAQAASAPTPGYMGLKTISLTPSIATKYNLPSNTGLYVDQVESDSPAQQAGLETGDIITSVGSLQPAQMATPGFIGATYDQGQTVPVTYLTPQGAVRTVQLTFGSYPPDSAPTVVSI